MLHPYIVNAFAHASLFPQTGIRRAEDATVRILVRNNGEQWSGSVGVVTGPHTVLSAGHSFRKIDSKRKEGRKSALIYFPFDGEAHTPAEIRIIAAHDLAVLRFKERIATPSVQLETRDVDFGTPVLMPHFAQIKRPAKNMDARVKQIFDAPVIHNKGFLTSVMAQATTASLLPGYTGELSLFHVESRIGNSGAGLFTKQGKLLSIVNGGHRVFTTCGVPVGKLPVYDKKIRF